MLDLRKLADLVARYDDVLDGNVRSFELDGRTFSGHPASDVMAVVNLSPDSWYRESVCLTVNNAIQRGLRLFAEGAAIVDVGAESTLPDAECVDEAEQLNKLLPVIEGLTQESGGGLVSVECHDLRIAERCLKAGARIVNLTAARHSEEFYQLAQEHGAGVVACYVQGGEHVRDVGDFALAEDHMAVLLEYFSREGGEGGKVRAGAGVVRCRPWLLLQKPQRLRPAGGLSDADLSAVVSFAQTRLADLSGAATCL